MDKLIQNDFLNSSFKSVEFEELNKKIALFKSRFELTEDFLFSKGLKKFFCFEQQEILKEYSLNEITFHSNIDKYSSLFQMKDSKNDYLIQTIVLDPFYEESFDNFENSLIDGNVILL